MRVGDWLIAGVLGLIGCAPSLDSVRTTATIGSQLSTYDDVFDLGPDFCEAANVSKSPDSHCTDLRSDLQNWHAVNKALVGYAKALIAMADDSKDKNEKADISTALGSVGKVETDWKGLDENFTTGVSQGLASIASGIIGVYRRERLAKAIKETNSSLKKVVEGLDANIDDLARADGNLLAIFADTTTSVTAGDSPAAVKSGLKVSLAAVAIQVAAHRARLVDYKKAADSFVKAHDDLATHLEKLGDKDGDVELLKLIATDVVSIAKAVNTASTRNVNP